MLSMKNIQIAPGISGLFRKTAITLAAAGMAAAIAISGIIAPAPAGADNHVTPNSTSSKSPTNARRVDSRLYIKSGSSRTTSST